MNKISEIQTPYEHKKIQYLPLPHSVINNACDTQNYKYKEAVKTISRFTRIRASSNFASKSAFPITFAALTISRSNSSNRLRQRIIEPEMNNLMKFNYMETSCTQKSNDVWLKYFIQKTKK